MTRTPRRRLAWSVVIAAALLAACVVPSGAQAQAPLYGGGWRGDGAGGDLVLPALLRSVHLTPDQQSQVQAILSSHRVAARPIVQQLRQAQDELADKLVAPGQLQMSELGPQLQQISRLRDQLLQNSAQATLEIRALLTPDQLTKAAQVKDRLRQLRSEMRQLLGPGQP